MVGGPAALASPRHLEMQSLRLPPRLTEPESVFQEDFQEDSCAHYSLGLWPQESTRCCEGGWFIHLKVPKASRKAVALVVYRRWVFLRVHWGEVNKIGKQS